MCKKLITTGLFMALTLFLSVSSCNVATDNESNASVAQSKIEVSSGTYTSTTIGMTLTVTFKSNNTIECYNRLDGKRVFKYSISSDGETITLTNIVTNQTTVEEFKYIKKQGCVVFSDIAYFK